LDLRRSIHIIRSMMTFKNSKREQRALMVTKNSKNLTLIVYHFCCYCLFTLLSIPENTPTELHSAVMYYL
ncbi:hypothetical protein MKW94_019460, partial [Papaver nudicaule]|nr:hypothetical protein [Papaver nudicaule]